MNDDNDGRNLPIFDNHYSNTTLLDNWQEDRCQFNIIRNTSADGIEETQKKRIPFTLTGVNTEDYAEMGKKWGEIQSTYKQNFDANILQNAHPAAIITPPSVNKTLLLSSKNADYDTFVGEPTSKTYGAHYATHHNSTLNSQAQSFYFNDSGKVHDGNSYSKNNPKNLYESLKLKEQHFNKWLIDRNESTGRDTQKHNTSKERNHRNTEYVTTKQMADKKVDAFYFQRRLPPMN